MVLNYYGVEGLRERIRGHIALAEGFAGWVDAHENFELLAPVEFSTVCFRFVPAGAGPDDEKLDELNLRLVDSVNATGEAFLSHARIRGRIALRCAIGNIRTNQTHIDALQKLLNARSAEL
jgi:aromatic-L-amino-acid decarboxylase